MLSAFTTQPLMKLAALTGRPQPAQGFLLQAPWDDSAWLSTSRPAWPTLLLRAMCPRWPSACALPCSGKVGAGLAVQSVAVTSTAQKRRHFRLHIPVLRLEVGDQAPHLHGDSAVGSILLCKLTLGKRKKTKQNPKLGGSEWRDGGSPTLQGEKKEGNPSHDHPAQKVPEAISYSFRHKEGNCCPAPTLNWRLEALIRPRRALIHSNNYLLSVDCFLYWEDHHQAPQGMSPTIDGAGKANSLRKVSQRGPGGMNVTSPRISRHSL